jgi:signal transduction histidine kinase
MNVFAYFQLLIAGASLLLEKTFFRPGYLYQRVIKELSQAAASLADTRRLLKLAAETMIETMRVERVMIYLQDQTDPLYRARESLSRTNEGVPPAIMADDILLAHLSKVKKALVAAELAWEIESRGGGEKESELMAVLVKLTEMKAALCLPLFHKERLTGLICLGDKLSRAIFNIEDVDLLTTLANQLAIALENAELREQVNKTRTQLLQADKLSLLGRVAAGVLHELKNPLAALKGMTQAIGSNLDDREFLEDFQRVVPRELDRLDVLVEGIAQLGRPPRLVYSQVKLNELIDQNLKLHEQRCRNRRIAVEKSLCPLPEIEADPQQLIQVLTNLVLNAIEAMPEGGRLSVATSSGSGRVVLEVADTGKGIPPEGLKEIFEPFFTTSEKGFGLGLAITGQIIKGHNGEITVESEVGKGTTFRISLPG